MTFTLQLTFDVHLKPLGDEETERHLQGQTDSTAAERRVWRQQEILRRMSSCPQMARAYAALSVMQQAHDELNDYLLDLLSLPEDSPYYLFRPAISHLPIEDQEQLIDAELDGEFYREVELLMRGGDVRLKDARLRVREF